MGPWPGLREGPLELGPHPGSREGPSQSLCQGTDSIGQSGVARVGLGVATRPCHGPTLPDGWRRSSWGCVVAEAEPRLLERLVAGGSRGLPGLAVWRGGCRRTQRRCSRILAVARPAISQATCQEPAGNRGGDATSPIRRITKSSSKTKTKKNMTILELEK